MERLQVIGVSRHVGQQHSLGFPQYLKHKLLVGKTTPPVDLLALALCRCASAALYGSLGFARLDLDGSPIAGL
jgi:hypothetical protein